MMLRRTTRRLWNLFGYDADFWRGPLLLGALLAAATWAVWYFTKVPCTADNALKGMCNPGILASFVNADIMTRCTAAWIGATTLTGGINAIMLERERQRTSDAQQQLAAERKLHDETRKLHDETRKRYDEQIEALINEQRAERRIADEVRRAADEERRIADAHAAATQQAMLATIAELTGAIAELRRQNNNGNDSANRQS